MQTPWAPLTQGSAGGPAHQPLAHAQTIPSMTSMQPPWAPLTGSAGGPLPSMPMQAQQAGHLPDAHAFLSPSLPSMQGPMQGSAPIPAVQQVWRRPLQTHTSAGTARLPAAHALASPSMEGTLPLPTQATPLDLGWLLEELVKSQHNFVCLFVGFQ
jgi:hypothetical protein